MVALRLPPPIFDSMGGHVIRSFLTMLAVLALTACSLPRGAGVQSEILSAPSGEDAPQFAVHMVTRDFLPIAAAWPASRAGQESDGWDRSQRGPCRPGDSAL